MGKRQQMIGRGFEYRVVHKAQAYKIPAKRIVLSGSTEEKLDVEIAGMRFECKYRSSGLKSLFTWLEKTERDGGIGVVIGGGRNNPIVVMRLEKFLRLIGGMKNHESSKG